MLGIDGRTLRVVWTIYLFSLAVVGAYLIRSTLIEFAIAIFFSYLLAPIVGQVARLMPKRSNLALALVYVVMLAVLVTAGVNIVSRIAEQAASLAARLPAMMASPHQLQISLPSWAEPYKAKVYEAAQQEAKALSESAVPFLRRAGGQLLSGLGSIIPVILIPILSFFLLKDAGVIRDTLIGLQRNDRNRKLLRGILDDIHTVLSKYIQALAALSIASFAAWFIFLEILGTPYQLLLAGLAGLLEFIPVIGPTSAAVIVLIVAAVTGSGGFAWILIFWVAFRMFQDYVLNPLLMSSGVEVHPLLVLFGILAGERIGGIPGMFFAVPVIAILKIVYTRARQRRDRTEPAEVLV
jgi:predicted PurR-regulated permease PerM